MKGMKLTSKEGDEYDDETKYRHIVGSLIYLTTTKPYISFEGHRCVT
jgi:hypothetical protein